MKDVDSLTAVNNFKYFGVDTKDVWREIIQAQANTLEFLGLKKMSFKLFWSLFVQGSLQLFLSIRSFLGALLFFKTKDGAIQRY